MRLLSLCLLCCCLAAETVPAPGTKVPLGYWSEAVLDTVDITKVMSKRLTSPAEWDRYAERQQTKADAISARLEAFIRAWAAGDNDGQIPAGMLPRGLDNEKLGGWRVVAPEDVTPEQQWWLRRAHDIDFDALYFLYPDNHCAYAKIAYLAPFGSTLVMEGAFPHARFFDLQVAAPYDPLSPATVGFGAGEVPIVDVDINPLPGHTNPFRIGADRSAQKRSYRVDFPLASGNASALNPSFAPPAYRGAGNSRVGGPFRDAGPAFDGMLHPGVLWMRYYLPDHKAGPLAGVPLPKAHLELATGERFWLLPTSLDLVATRQSTPVATRRSVSTGGLPGDDARWGWSKGFGIALSALQRPIRNGVVDKNRIAQRVAKNVVRSIDGGLFNRGADRAAPNNYAVCATGCSYIHYLGRSIDVEAEHVAVVTGRLPSTPHTADGQGLMTGAQARYWSIVHYDNSHKPYAGALMGSLCDEDIAQRDGRYAIVFSTAADRPANTAAPGITWNDWGPVGRQGITIRWLSVDGGWEDQQITPNEKNAPWTTCSWSQPTYKEALLGLNKPGLLGEYHPVIHYLSHTEFEALGPDPLTALQHGPVRWTAPRDE
ncbi:MAG: hypothetical protein PF961_22865 [Planctomycetota bacterium]|nr:hypothetical protein [Planctomycetota bacterium]